MLLGVVTNKTSGIWVYINDLRAEYGPLSYMGSGASYDRGDRVAVSRVGPDEYVVVGVVHP